MRVLVPLLEFNLTRATERGIIGKELATIFKLADIAVGLDLAPGAKGIKAGAAHAGVRQRAFRRLRENKK
jgi:hypothetical protein